jgi:hypothetical protein
MASPNNSTTSNATARQSKQYFCDCSRYCKSRRLQVSRPTYQRHAPFRQIDVDKRLARSRRDNHGQSNGIDIEQPRITVGTAGRHCGVSDDTTLEASLEGHAPESDPPQVCNHPLPGGQQDTTIFVGHHEQLNKP